MNIIIIIVFFLISSFAHSQTNDGKLFNDKFFDKDDSIENTSKSIQKAKGKLKSQMSKQLGIDLVNYIQSLEQSNQKEGIKLFTLYQKNSFNVLNHYADNASKLSDLNKFTEWFNNIKFESEVWQTRCAELEKCSLGDNLFIE